MRKEVLLALALSVGSAALAQDPMRGLNWGDGVPAGFRRVEVDETVRHATYVNPLESGSLGTAKVDRVEYEFPDGHLDRILVTFAGQDNYAQLKKALEGWLGVSGRPAKPVLALECYQWSSERAFANLSYSSASEESLLILTARDNNPSAETYREEELERRLASRVARCPALLERIENSIRQGERAVIQKETTREYATPQPDPGDAASCVMAANQKANSQIDQEIREIQAKVDEAMVTRERVRRECGQESAQYAAIQANLRARRSAPPADLSSGKHLAP